MLDSTTHTTPVTPVTLVTLVALVAAVTLSTPALGQGATWNRKVEGVSVTPLPLAGSFFDITFHFSAGAEGALSAPLSLDTEALVLVNGTAIDLLTFEIDVEPTGGGACGGGCSFPELCHCGFDPHTGVFGCGCGPFLTFGSTSASLQPGDEIMVLLRPAPGAVPDDDEADDTLVIPFEGDTIYWNRRIAGATAVPTAGAPDNFFDVWIAVEAVANYPGILALPTTLQLQVNGVIVAEAAHPAFETPLVWNPCQSGVCDESFSCVAPIGGGPSGTCDPQPGPYPCGCTYTPGDMPIFEAVPIDPGDEIVVILRPVPGALPELPGFPEDDEHEVPLPDDCPADVSGDTVVDVQDMVAIILDWGCTSPPDECPGDVNGDGVVDVLDLVAAILAWGPCQPV